MARIIAESVKEMQEHTQSMMRQFANIIFANAAAMKRLKAKGISEKHPAMQFLNRERRLALAHYQALREGPK